MAKSFSIFCEKIQLLMNEILQIDSRHPVQVRAFKTITLRSFTVIFVPFTGRVF